MSDMLGQDVKCTGVRGSFDRAAHSYDGFSTIQRSVAKELCALIGDIDDADTILDVGCGTGHVGSEISNRGRLFQIDISEKMCGVASGKNFGFTINCDMQAMPFPANFFSVVVSSMAVHWAQDICASLHGMLRVLSGTGRGLFISVPVRGTLEELSVCERLVNRGQRFTFRDTKFFTEIISSLGGKVEYVQCKEYTLKHKTCIQLLSSITKTGAQFFGGKAGTARDILDVCRTYSNLFSRDGMVVSSWNVAYFIIKKQFY
ncbi:methyltransferase domain-containing protein [Anaplasma capra]|nr:methyltransferase domain-containing protein [Anaplasma capra]MCU7612301.1 methyltransferase domain-containing protein [Anaplasma capra]